MDYSKIADKIKSIDDAEHILKVHCNFKYYFNYLYYFFFYYKSAIIRSPRKGFYN